MSNTFQEGRNSKLRLIMRNVSLEFKHLQIIDNNYKFVVILGADGLGSRYYYNMGKFNVTF